MNGQIRSMMLGDIKAQKPQASQQQIQKMLQDKQKAEQDKLSEYRQKAIDQLKQQGKQVNEKQIKSRMKTLIKESLPTNLEDVDTSEWAYMQQYILQQEEIAKTNIQNDAAESFLISQGVSVKRYDSQNDLQGKMSALTSGKNNKSISSQTFKPYTTNSDVQKKVNQAQQKLADAKQKQQEAKEKKAEVTENVAKVVKEEEKIDKITGKKLEQTVKSTEVKVQEQKQELRKVEQPAQEGEQPVIVTHSTRFIGSNPLSIAASTPSRLKNFAGFGGITAVYSQDDIDRFRDQNKHFGVFTNDAATATMNEFKKGKKEGLSIDQKQDYLYRKTMQGRYSGIDFLTGGPINPQMPYSSSAIVDFVANGGLEDEILQPDHQKKKEQRQDQLRGKVRSIIPKMISDITQSQLQHDEYGDYDDFVDSFIGTVMAKGRTKQDVYSIFAEELQASGIDKSNVKMDEQIAGNLVDAYWQGVKAFNDDYMELKSYRLIDGLKGVPVLLDKNMKGDYNSHQQLVSALQQAGVLDIFQYSGDEERAQALQELLAKYPQRNWKAKEESKKRKMLHNKSLIRILINLQLLNPYRIKLPILQSKPTKKQNKPLLMLKQLNKVQQLLMLLWRAEPMRSKLIKQRLKMLQREHRQLRIKQMLLLL